MGEMADDAVDIAFDAEEQWDNYAVGNMPTAEAYERGIIDELGYETNSQTGLMLRNKVCRCCGESGLHWRKVKGKWRLYKESKIHKCPVNPCL